MTFTNEGVSLTHRQLPDDIKAELIACKLKSKFRHYRILPKELARSIRFFNWKEQFPFEIMANLSIFGLTAQQFTLLAEEYMRILNLPEPREVSNNSTAFELQEMADYKVQRSKLPELLQKCLELKNKYMHELDKYELTVKNIKHNLEMLLVEPHNMSFSVLEKLSHLTIIKDKDTVRAKQAHTDRIYYKNTRNKTTSWILPDFVVSSELREFLEKQQRQKN